MPAHHHRRVTRLALLFTACLLLGAAPAHAALPITFDGLTANTQVTNQFAADGVTFIDPNGTPSSVNERPRVADVGAKANSGTKVALSDCFACEFDHHVILAQLSTFAETASVRVGINTASPVSVQVRLEALNASSTVIGTTTATIGSANFKTLMTVDPAGTDNVAFVRVRTFAVADAGFQLGIDDLTFTTTGTGAAAFSVLPRTSGARVRQGGTTTVPVDVLRFNGSSGNVTLSGQDLPHRRHRRVVCPEPGGRLGGRDIHNDAERLRDGHRRHLHRRLDPRYPGERGRRPVPADQPVHAHRGVRLHGQRDTRRVGRTVRQHDGHRDRLPRAERLRRTGHRGRGGVGRLRGVAGIHGARGRREQRPADDHHDAREPTRHRDGHGPCDEPGPA
ncbi:hypothetical protein LRS13_24750 [Svornostia abyssi]|uniref:Uncharacterized protein n=1 Tax=Svornostia abyssi TaxID=2898438 RepID=A0ABY5PH95_9ACTN|nr:hypothetical protein LRS13_24750 [Parviterribacteraceae bacterium J379]